MRKDVSWPGYAPWASTVAECRREFVRIARSFWLIPELIAQPSRDDVGRARFGLMPPAPPHDPSLHRAVAGWRGAT